MSKPKSETHQTDTNCRVPDLVQAFSCVENGELNLVL